MRSVAAQGLRGSTRLCQHVRLFSAGAPDYTDPYLDHTVIPTYHFQDSLPKLPVPKLEDTLRRYKYFTEPLVSSKQHERTKRLADAFLAGEGAKLNEELKARDAAKYSNYISEPWFDMYLESRDGLMINVTPQLTFLDNPNQTDQAQRAAAMICSSVRFYRTLKEGKLSPDIFHTKPKDSETERYKRFMSLLPRRVAFYGSFWYGAYPLDMSQYERLFSSTRVPKLGKDELVGYTPEQSRHVIVQHGTDFFKVDVVDSAGTLLPYAQIYNSLKSILAKPVQSGPALGVLTAMDRDSWAKTREEMLVSEKNKASLEAIDSALFAVCLEDDAPVEYSDVMSCMLHGKGRNRWYDKSFQLIVTKNAKAAVAFEHAWGDGVAVLRYFNEVYKDSLEYPTEASEAPITMEPLEFELSDSVRGAIEKASTDADKLIKSIELATQESDMVGRKFLKDKKIGPDGFMQMAFQLAHEKMHGKTVSTYESANASHYKHGRTETIRSATPEASKFAKVFAGGNASKEEKAEVMKTAIARHGQITKDAMTGKGKNSWSIVLQHYKLFLQAWIAIFLF